MTYIDTHAHLNDKTLYPIREQVRQSYLSAGIEKVINVGCNLPAALLAKSIAKEYEECYFTVGVHPEDANTVDEKTLFELEKAAGDKKCVAIGEAGLDYHYSKDNVDEQKSAFLKQIDLAQKTGLPLVIHSRDATADTLGIVKNNLEKLKNGFLLHCFSGSKEVAEIYNSMGAYFSFGGVVTFKNGKKEEVIKAIPMTKILVETDCPYMSPEPHRGEVNEPKNIPYIVKKIASIYGEDEEVVKKITGENALRFFGKLNG